ncbi:unnamed protein product [Rotaria sordida]|uniref:Uncharacterized protein n=1 Tax=Rotaria sordida TaxID=392033 RepID=A0A813R7V2_9BILA|nr:unnamed protein product [Rotaria sordida]CAF0824219.1 unnamed protein product [Rotaria sordida]CAF1081751.1 unnamed protein product [Rotaria sordida]CAF1521296.1 unnamed protein product [Rotaria sordida]CAF1622303.1 unnamed protein product [Rotaria sordida]
MISYGRPSNSPEQLMSMIFSPGNTDGNSVIAPSNSPNRLIHVIENIIRYVSSIKSSENFIENVVNRHKEPADRMKVLTFLNKCFELIRNVIQREINYMLEMSEIQNKSSHSQSPFTLEELKQAQRKTDDLLASIEKQMESLKTWIPPTMPFLGFF